MLEGGLEAGQILVVQEVTISLLYCRAALKLGSKAEQERVSWARQLVVAASGLEEYCCVVVPVVVRWELESVGKDEDQDRVGSLDLQGDQSILEAEAHRGENLARDQTLLEEGAHNLDQTDREEDRSQQTQRGEDNPEEVRRENRAVGRQG